MGIIEHHIIPAIGAIKLKQLSSIHIQRMYNDLKENGRMQRGSKQNDKALSNTFVRRVHAVLQAALKQAVKERLIPYNPCENCRIPPKDKKEMTILPPEKIGRYLQEAEKYGVLPMFYLELSSGLRRGELLALQWEDLNVKERILTVNKQVTRMEGELDVTEPKTKTLSARWRCRSRRWTCWCRSMNSTLTTLSCSRRPGQAATGVRTPCRGSTGSC